MHYTCSGYYSSVESKTQDAEDGSAKIGLKQGSIHAGKQGMVLLHAIIPGLLHGCTCFLASTLMALLSHQLSDTVSLSY